MAELPFSFKSVQEPSNIMFENKFDSDSFTTGRKFISFFVLFALVLLGFLSIFFTQKKTSYLYREYPLYDCDSVSRSYQEENQLKIYAMIEWYHLETSTIGRETLLRFNTGNLQCFCDQLSSDLGRELAMSKKFKVSAKGEVLQGAICHDYIKSYYLIKYFKFVVPLLIEAINFIVKIVTKMLIKWIKYDNASQAISKMVSIEYLLNFFNTGLIIVIVNSNLRSTEY